MTSRPSIASIDFAFGDLFLGQTASLRWTVEEEELDRFAALSGDFNEAHVLPEFARSRGYADRFAHGFLLGAKVSALVGMQLPGRNCLILEQSLSYPAPIFPGDVIDIVGTVVSLSATVQSVKVKIRASKQQDARSVVVGRGFVLCRCA